MDLATKPRCIKQHKILNSAESMSTPLLKNVDMPSFRPTTGGKWWWVIMSFHLPSHKDSELCICNASLVLIWSTYLLCRSFLVFFVTFIDSFHDLWPLPDSDSEFCGKWLAESECVPLEIWHRVTCPKNCPILLDQIPSADHDQSNKLGLRPWSS